MCISIQKSSSRGHGSVPMIVTPVAGGLNPAPSQMLSMSSWWRGRRKAREGNQRRKEKDMAKACE